MSVTLAVFIHLYLNLQNVCSHIEDVHLLVCARLIISYYIFGSVEIRHYYIYTTFGVLTLCYLCVVCNSNSFHFFMIFHTLKMLSRAEYRLVSIAEKTEILENSGMYRSQSTAFKEANFNEGP